MGLASRPLPGAYALRPATITVSGYPQLTAVALESGSRAVGLALRSDDVLAFAGRQERVFTGHGAGEKSRCHNPSCRKWAPRSELADQRLGFDAYCTPCVEEGVGQCLARHGRLPGVGEFFCLGCQWICDVRAQARSDADGRRRSRCVLCRTDQVRQADERRRERRL